MNKHILIAAVLTAFLSGCQTTSRDVPITKLPSNTASPQEISDALTIDTLGGDEIVEQLEEAPVFDDVWERIRYQLSIEVPQNRPVVAERNYYATITAVRFKTVAYRESSIGT